MMPRPVDLSRARQSDINRDQSGVAAVTPPPPGPPKRAPVESVSPTPAPIPEPPRRSAPTKRPAAAPPAPKPLRQVQVMVPVRLRDLMAERPESHSDLVRIAYNQHYKDLAVVEPEQSAGPMGLVKSRRRRRSSANDPLVSLMLRLNDAERGLLDELAAATAMSRSSVVTALLERFFADPLD